ncbi:MAG: ATP-dependent helicase HrpB [Pseudomonadota bacterium]
MDLDSLPIAPLLPALCKYLGRAHNAIIIAPPGAGKSTAIPMMLLEQGFAAKGAIAVLQPRRVAVRSLAARLSELHGGPLGDAIGYQMRDESRVSAKTKLIVMTEGVLRQRLLADPALEGLTAVLFDEFHERSLNADLCLALSRDTQGSLRPDLKLLLMSATLDKEGILPALPTFEVFESQGRSFPIETIYLPLSPNAHLPAAAAQAVRRAVSDTEGDVLCFLPGVRDIRAVASQLEGADFDVFPLYGALPIEAQKAVLKKPQSAKRRVIVATDIAETSLTLPDISAVVDAGLRRAPFFDLSLGLTELRTQKASRASVDQRRGRAGRTGPGTCYRLWPAQSTRALPAADAPEMLTQDLADVALACADWGADPQSDLDWIDTPPMAALLAAQERLQKADLLDAENRITQFGRAAAQMPLPWDLAAFMLGLAHTPRAKETAVLCAILGETSTGLEGQDLERAVKDLEARGDSAAQRILSRADRLQKTAENCAATLETPQDSWTLGAALARSRPWLIGRRDPTSPGRFKLVSGRAALVDAHSSLASAPWLVVGTALLAGQNARVLSAWPLTQEDVLQAAAPILERGTRVTLDEKGFGVRETYEALGALRLGSRTAKLDAGPELATLLRARLEAEGLSTLAWPQDFLDLQHRVAFARRFDASVPDMSFEALFDAADLWLEPVLLHTRSLSDLDFQDLAKAAKGLIPFQVMARVDALAPQAYALPSGQQATIAYQPDGTAGVAAKLQAFFGATQHPTVASGAVPLTLTLLSPAGRPLQTTQDLPGFWDGSYSDVRRDMRGRYPKHPWPEDPRSALPTMRPKPRR